MTDPQPSPAEVVRLEVPAEPGYLALVRTAVAATARLDPLFDEARIDDLRVIVSEACTNAIEAMRRARGDGPVGHIVVECRLTPSQLEILIGDSGGGFDPTRVRALPAANDPERLQHERGLGLPLIRALADDLDIESGPDGTTLRVVIESDPDPVEGLA